MVLLINNDVGRRMLAVDDVLESLEDAFVQLGEGDAAYRQMSNYWFESQGPNKVYRFGDQLGAILRPPRVALRIKSDIREQPDGREIRYNVEEGKNMRFILLFDGESGELLSIMNDRELQRLRVGATAGLACDCLAKEDSFTVGMIGAGGMARTHLQSFAAVRDLNSVRVYSPTTENREQYAEEMSEELKIDVESVSDPQSAVRGADIVSTCTNSERPVYETEWMESGQFITNVRAKEIPDGVRESADRVTTSTNEPYFEEFVGEVDRTVGPASLTRTEYDTLAEIVAEIEPGREDDRQSIFFENRAVSIQFPAVCNLVYEKAAASGLGMELPLDWFQQKAT